MEKSDKNEWLIWRLTDLSYQNPDDIESNELEITGEDAEGRDAYCTVKINEMAGDAVIRIRELESQIAAKGKQEWISLSKSCPKSEYSYDIWIKSSEREDYGRRIAGAMFYDGHFHTEHHQQPVTHPEYISHFMTLPEAPSQ